MSVNRVQLLSLLSVKRVCFGKLQTSLCINFYIEAHPPGTRYIQRMATWDCEVWCSLWDSLQNICTIAFITVLDYSPVVLSLDVRK